MFQKSRLFSNSLMSFWLWVAHSNLCSSVSVVESWHWPILDSSFPKDCRWILLGLGANTQFVGGTGEGSALGYYLPALAFRKGKPVCLSHDGSVAPWVPTALLFHTVLSHLEALSCSHAPSGCEAPGCLEAPFHFLFPTFGKMAMGLLFSRRLVRC